MAAQAERLSDAKPRYAEIAVDAKVGPDRTFTYLIPSSATSLDSPRVKLLIAALEAA